MLIRIGNNQLSAWTPWTTVVLGHIGADARQILRHHRQATHFNSLPPTRGTPGRSIASTGLKDHATKAMLARSGTPVTLYQAQVVCLPALPTGEERSVKVAGNIRPQIQSRHNDFANIMLPQERANSEMVANFPTRPQ